MVKLLKEMLQLEAKDKEFLLSNITRITEGKGNGKYLFHKKEKHQQECDLNKLFRLVVRSYQLR